MGSNPYASLEPGRRREPVPLYPEVSTSTVLLRGLRKRCPRCADRDTFVGWFRMRTACSRCDLRFAKEEGGFLGAMTLNYVVAIGIWLVMLGVALVLTVPTVPVVPLLALSAVILIGIPLWFYPRSRMLWAAIEFLVHRSDPDYRAPVARDPRTRDLE
ncbi:MAG TPA: DUF983 domain-containing protein [Actinomycetota bacterium]|jgi:uncharacterized protein (DUF983 family)|nr:DUF983 domain-containing protein [Actinomycetota bacterium]